MKWQPIATANPKFETDYLVIPAAGVPRAVTARLDRKAENSSNTKSYYFKQVGWDGNFVEGALEFEVTHIAKIQYPTERTTPSA